jgi:hypothetical protein
VKDSTVFRRYKYLIEGLVLISPAMFQPQLDGKSHFEQSTKQPETESSIG